MLIEKDARELGAKVVAAAKATAHVDTGYLKRSIAFTYVRGIMIFRQVFYGVYYENSKLEYYAKQYIPNDQQWKIILTNMEGEEIEIGRTQSGRATRRITKPYQRTGKTSTDSINKLIAIAKAKADGEKKNT